MSLPVRVEAGRNPDGSPDGDVILDVQDCITARLPVETFRQVWEQGGHVLEWIKANSDPEG